jgi:hypothetical protein
MNCREPDVFEQIVIGRPYPAFAYGERGKALINLAGLVAVGVTVHPCLNGVAVLRAGDAQGDQC